MINCIAVDDEPKALDIIKIHASKSPDINLIDSFTHPEKALAFLKDNYVDLVFLDINMPHISGLDFIEKLQFKPNIIFTTAYSEYALDSYEFEAVDYLLKPIEFDRFNKAIQKAKRLIQLNTLHQDSFLKTFIFVKDGYRQVKIVIDDILFIQSEGNYLNIETINNKVVTRMTFQQLMEKLPRDIFIRIHNSYIVNLVHTNKIEDNHIFIQEAKIPIGIKYKEGLANYLKTC